MTCPLTRKQLAAALDSRLPAIDPRHIASCSACQQEQRALGALLAALQEPPPAYDDDAFTARVLRQLDAQPMPSARERMARWVLAPLACAAAAALVCGAALLEHHRGRASERASGPPAQAAGAAEPTRGQPMPAPAQHVTSGLDRLVEQFAAHGDFVSAERVCAESLAIKAQALGLEHPAVAAQRVTLQILVRLTTDA